MQKCPDCNNPENLRIDKMKKVDGILYCPYHAWIRRKTNLSFSLPINLLLLPILLAVIAYLVYYGVTSGSSELGASLSIVIILGLPLLFSLIRGFTLYFSGNETKKTKGIRNINWNLIFVGGIMVFVSGAMIIRFWEEIIEFVFSAKIIGVPIAIFILYFVWRIFLKDRI